MRWWWIKGLCALVIVYTFLYILGRGFSLPNDRILVRKSLREVVVSSKKWGLQLAWNGSDKGVVPLDGGEDGWLLMTPWREETSLKARLSLLPQFAVQEATEAQCEDGTTVIVGGYDPSYQLVRKKLQLFREGHFDVVDMPKGMAETHHGATCHNNVLYVVSGQDGRGCSPATRRVFSYSLKTGKFAALPDLPKARYAPGVAVCSTKGKTWLHVFGGAGENRREPAFDHWRLELAEGAKSWESLEAMPPGSSGSHGFVSKASDASWYYGGTLYGDAQRVDDPKHTIGKDCVHSPNATTSSHVWRFDCDTQTWMPHDQGTMIVAAGHAPLLHVGYNVSVLLGGSNDGAHPSSKAAQVFHRGQWMLGHDLPEILKGAFAWIAPGGRLWLHYSPWVPVPVPARSASQTRLFLTTMFHVSPVFRESEIFSGPSQTALKSVSQWQIVQPLTRATKPKRLPVIPVLLNLANRVDRLWRMLLELEDQCFFRMEAVSPTFDEAVAEGIIDWGQFSRDLTRRFKMDFSGWWKSWVKVPLPDLYRGHSGVKISMAKLFEASEEASIKNMEERLGRISTCRSLSGALRPVMILEDDSHFLSRDWKIVEDALAYLNAKAASWHLLYISFREQKDWDEGIDDDGKAPVVRVKYVLGNTATIVNPKRGGAEMSQVLLQSKLGGLAGSALDWVCLNAIQNGTWVAYRLRERFVAPFKSMSSIHGTEIVYSDTTEE